MDFTKLDALMDTLEPVRGVPGCQIAVHYQGKTVHSYAAGWADEARTRRVSPKDVYILYSASKVITNTGLMILLERGDLRLEDPVSKYLPEFASMKVLNGLGVRDAQNPITIRDLSTMCGGLTYNLDTPWIRKAKAEGKNTTRELMAAIASEPLLFEPGTHYNYSLCHDVLGAVFEVVTGKTFGEFLRDEIFEPLGMPDTTFFPNEEQRSRITAQYTFDGATRTVKKVPDTCVYQLAERYESGGAGLYSTADDYIKLLACLSQKGLADNGFRLLKPETVELMRTPMLSGFTKADFDKIGRYGYSYGLGVRTMVDPQPFGFRTPLREFGWDGAASTYVSIDADNGLSFFFGMQVLGYGEIYDQVHWKLRELVYESVGL